MSKTILISGICGFIGKRIAERALSLGWKVKGIDNNKQMALKLSEKLFIDILVGDTTNLEDVQLATEGADLVVHTAAVVKERGDISLFRKVNVEGTLNIAQKAKQNGAKQFIHLSSVMVYGFNFPANADESSPLAGENNPYCITKIESEKALMPLNDNTFGVTILRPSDVYGPGSIPWVIRPLEMMFNRQFMHIDNGTGIFNSLYVDNLVDAIFYCVDDNAFGKTYNVTDDAPLSNKSYFDTLALICGAPSIPSLPQYIAKPICFVADKMFQLIGKESPVNIEAIKYMTRPNSYSCEKIKNELGYFPKIDLKEGLDLTLSWLKINRPDLLR